MHVSEHRRCLSKPIPDAPMHEQTSKTKRKWLRSYPVTESSGISFSGFNFRQMVDRGFPKWSASLEIVHPSRLSFASSTRSILGRTHWSRCFSITTSGSTKLPKPPPPLVFFAPGFVVGGGASSAHRSALAVSHLLRLARREKSCVVPVSIGAAWGSSALRWSGWGVSEGDRSFWNGFLRWAFQLPSKISTSWEIPSSLSAMSWEFNTTPSSLMWPLFLSSVPSGLITRMRYSVLFPSPYL